MDQLPLHFRTFNTFPITIMNLLATALITYYYGKRPEQWPVSLDFWFGLDHLFLPPPLCFSGRRLGGRHRVLRVLQLQQAECWQGGGEYSVQRRSSPGCDDTFHSNTSTTAYTDQCLAGKKGRWAAVARSGQSSACCVSRDGVFPASHCIKLVGVLGKSRHLDTATV